MEGLEEIAVNEWAQGLAGLTGDQIKNGLDSWKGEWPPSLPEFRSACIPVVEKIHKEYVKLPAPKTNPEIVKAQIEAMRKIAGY
jgi:hypothetical protein